MHPGYCAVKLIASIRATLYAAALVRPDEPDDLRAPSARNGLNRAFQLCNLRLKCTGASSKTTAFELFEGALKASKPLRKLRHFGLRLTEDTHSTITRRETFLNPGRSLRKLCLGSELDRLCGPRENGYDKHSRHDYRNTPAKGILLLEGEAFAIAERARK